MGFRRILFIILAALIALFFLSSRLYNFENRFVFDHDQQEAANASWRIIVEKKPILIGQETSTGGLFVGPFLYWFQSIALYIGRLNPLSLGYLGILVSFVTLIILFKVISEISTKWQALIGTFIYAISIRLMTYDMSGNAITYMMLFSLLIFLLLFKIIVKKQFGLLPILALVLSLTLHIHFALISLIIPSLLVFLWQRPKIETKYIVLSIIIFILPLSTFFLFDLRHNHLIIHNLLTFLATSKGSSSSHILETTKTFVSLLVESVFIRGNYSILIFLAIISIFVYQMKKSSNRTVHVLILTLLFLPLSLFWFYKGPIPEYYFLPAVPIFIIATSYVYFYLAKRFKLSFLVIILTISFYNLSKIKDTNRISIPFGLKEYIVNSIITDSKSDTFNVYYQMPPGYNTGYQYLFKWMRKEPQEGGKNLYIIEFTEPDNFDPTRYYQSFPQSKILIQRHGFLHVISVK